MRNLKEYFSLQKSSNETNESDEGCQQNNQEEENQGNAEANVWLQFDKCNFWANHCCILRIAEQEVTEKMLGMLKILFVIKACRKLFCCGGRG